MIQSEVNELFDLFDYSEERVIIKNVSFGRPISVNGDKGEIAQIV